MVGSCGVRTFALACAAALTGCAGQPLEVASDAALAAAIAGIDAREAQVVVAVGDIARCRQLAPAAATARVAAAVVAAFPQARVITMGDHTYPRGARREYERCYAPTWGALNARTAPSPGNHDYKTADGTPYYEYFEQYARDPGARARGYYAFDLGEWRLYSLNSMLPMAIGTRQNAWLARDLAAANARCVLAYWHHPLFSSSFHGRRSGDRGRDAVGLWEVLEAHSAEVVVNGHAHMYERFGPQRRDGARSPNGLRQFVAGTGGASLDSARPALANSEYLEAQLFGVLVLVLRTTGFDWAFVGVDGVVRDASAAPTECR